MTRSSTDSSARIAIDAMGGDRGPAEVVAAVKLALEELPQLEPLLLLGRQETLEPLLAEAGLAAHPKLSLVHASEVIEMEDKPLTALKKKRDASMIRAIDMVKAGEAGSAVSCGNTGALMACGTLRLRTLEGVERPALATVMPHKTGHFILLDAGANPDSKPEHLVHNAVLGANYARVVLGLESPRVGLLTIGTEEGKGNELINQTHDLLKRVSPGLLNYSGLIEGLQVFENHVDVVVCDGFTGNVVLKTCESLFNVLFRGFLREELGKTPVRKIGALLSRGAFQAVKRQLSPERYGGAPLLGLRGTVLKAHGSSNRHAIMSAIRIASEITKKDMNHRIEREIALANDALQRQSVAS